jgi:3-methyl-2-oxobutanoate hydroxymethyltransferase
MAERVTVPSLQRMKHEGRKIVGVVAWDYQVARIADRAGAEIVSVGDSVGVNLWGQRNPLEVTMEQMLIVTQAVRRGVTRALVSVDLPFGPVQEGYAVPAAIRMVKEAGADLVKIDGAPDFPDAVTAVARAGIPVWAQFGITSQTALRHGVDYQHTLAPGGQVPAAMTGELTAQARRLEDAGAALLDFTNSGPVAGPEVAKAVTIPSLGLSDGSAPAPVPGGRAVTAGGVPHRRADDGLVRRQAGAGVTGGDDGDREPERAQHAEHHDGDDLRPPAGDDLDRRRGLPRRQLPEGREHRSQPGIRLLQGLLDLVENPLLALGQAHVLLRCVFAPVRPCRLGARPPLRRLGPALTAAVTNYDMPPGSRAIPP